MSPLPNVALLREQSHPEVYFLCGGAKLWVPSVAEFSACGFDWSKVQVVPDGTLAGVPTKPFVAPPAVKASDVFFTCPKPDTRDILGNLWTQNGKRGDCIIRKNVLVAGWITWDIDRAAHPEGPYANSNATGVEDFHYELVLDPDFIARMYGPGGLTTVLNNLIVPGNPPRNPPPPLEEIRPPLLFQDVDPITHQGRGVTLNSFYLPGGGHSLHCELNCWHVHDTGTPFRYNFYGRGPAPAGWLHVPCNGFDDCWWPFDPRNPDGTGPLRPGDYILMRGTLWDDIAHDDPGQPDDWEHEPTEFLGGWMEIHPPDWIVKLTGPAPAQHQTYAYVSLITPYGNAATSQSSHLDIYPDFAPSPGNRPRVAGVQELVDGRFTDMSTVGSHTFTPTSDHVSVNVEIHSSSGRQGRFKATYIVSWQEETDPCAPYRDEINTKRAVMESLKQSLIGLDPRLDRVEIRRINAQLATLRAEIQTIQAQAMAAGCGQL